MQEGQVDKLPCRVSLLCEFIGSETGYCKSFNSKLRDEPLNMEIFRTLREAQVRIE